MVKEGRTTVYNRITSEEKLAQVNPENMQLEQDFLDYLVSIDKAKGTIKQYRANLNVFFVWNLEYNENKVFVDLTKRELTKFQLHALNEWGWSPRRVRTVKATLSSFSNYIADILDDEYEKFKPIVHKVASPADVAVRTKSVFTFDDLQPLFDYLVEHEQYEKACMLSLAVNSGRRKNELIHFKTNYFDDENIVCRGAFYKTPEKMKTKGRGSHGKMLDIYVFKKPFQHYLNLWMKQREEEHIKSEWLFPRKEDGKWLDEPIKVCTMDSWARSFTNIVGKSFYWHSLRHYFTSYLAKNGVPDSVIQEIMGWDSADMVRIYDDTSTEEKFDKYFGEDGIKHVKPNSLEDL